MNCLNCNENLYSRHKTAKYCSKACWKQYSYKYEKKESLWKKEFRKCKLCDTKYNAKSYNQIFCSRICADRTKTTEYIAKNINNSNSQFIPKYIKLRFSVLNRDSFTCIYCGRSPSKDKSVVLHVDHKIPKSKGGEDSIDNLVTACAECNLGKGDILIALWNAI